MPRHFIIGGAQRSATTYLYKLLDQHPEVSMARPARPEPKYFIRSDYRDDLETYRATCFADAPQGTTWLGEKSTSYLEHPAAAERIARLIPDVQMIFILRDPVERALSNYRFSVMHGLETLTLADALDAEPERTAIPGISVSPFAYVARGRYVEQLEAWARHVPASQMLLLTTERLVGTPSGVGEVFATLGLEPLPAPAGIGVAINRTAAESPVPSALRERLRSKFRDANAQLAARFGVDVRAWQ